MSPNPYFFMLFDLKRYREIEPVINDVLNQSVNADKLKPLLQEAVNIIESDEFKKYNDKSTKDEFWAFQSMINLINEGRFIEWIEKEYDEINEEYPENIAFDLITILCCPKYQLFCYEELPQSETTIDYIYTMDSFFGDDIYSILEKTGVEKLPYKRGACFFNTRQLAKFSKIISDDYELLRDPENSFEDLERQLKMVDFYERIINLLKLTSPSLTILNYFCLVR